MFTLFGTVAVKAAAVSSAEECLAEMAQETADYMRSRGLQITNSSYSFANSNGEKVYSLTSTDSVKAGARLNRTQSVIQHKNSEGQSDFYVINLDVQSEQMTYTIYRNSALHDKVELALYVPGGGSDPCAGALTQSQVDTILQNLLAQANADCKTRYTCLFQQMGPSCAYVMYMIKPTSWRCRIIHVDVQNAIDRAISRTSVTP
ncbi:MAG TPA: hypothetical protein VGB68_04060 [Pyrinomonadaceae bacterium]